MLPPGVSDSNDEDSDDDMYGPYPPYNTHPPAGSDRSYKQIDEGLVFLQPHTILILNSRQPRQLTKWIWITPAQKVIMQLNHVSRFLSKTIGNVFSGNGDGNTQRDPPNLDLSHAIKGMYRILDLISEQGSGGLGKLSCHKTT
jgi:hypothetical protein